MRRSLVVVAALAARAGGEPIVLAERELDAELVTEINLAHHFVGRPLSFAPDVWFGATERWTVGLVHSNPSVDRFTPGATFCLRHDGDLCDATYHGSGVDVRYGVLPWLAPRARFLVRDTDPFKPALALGGLARWARGRFSITGDPYLQLGLANRDQGNRAALVLPVAFGVAIDLGRQSESGALRAGRVDLALHTGWNSELAVIGDGWHVPVAVEARVHATTQLELGATLGFASLLGPQNTPKERALFVVIGWRQI